MPPPPKEFHCHGRQRPFAYRPGADLFEDGEAEQAYAKRQADAENELFQAGFRLVPGSNLWQRDGIHTTGDLIAREGIAVLETQAAAAVAVNFPERSQSPAADVGTESGNAAPGVVLAAAERPRIRSLSARSV